MLTIPYRLYQMPLYKHLLCIPLKLKYIFIERTIVSSYKPIPIGYN